MKPAANSKRKSASLKVVSANEATAVLKPMSWDATGELYVLNPKASREDVLSQLEGRLSQLHAMLTMACGTGFESFARWSHDIQDNYLWACKMLAKECKDLAGVDYV